MQRRSFLAGTGLAVGTATAGCMGLLSDDPVTFTAELANVPESVATGEGFDLEQTDTQVIEKTYEVADQSQTVEVTNRTAEYEKSVQLGPVGELRASIFTALSTPQVSVLGKSFNPVAEMSSAELAERIQDQYSEIGNLEAEREASITILGTETTETKFAGEITMDGQQLDIYLHVSSAVESAEDLVLGVGGYPQELPDEEDRVLTMMESIDHPV